MAAEKELSTAIQPRPISEIAAKCELLDEEILPYGRSKAKITIAALKRISSNPQGKLIVVTAISPTPAGEGKTVTSIGLGDGLRHIGKNAVICIREPSLGPVFGVKGGAAGGGKAQAYPSDELNLHFTGDFHAITAAHNLLMAMIEAHIQHGNACGFASHGVLWGRVLDVADRSLRQCITGIGGKSNGTPRETGFAITAASEVMALVSLSTSLANLKQRLGEIVVGVTNAGDPIRARDLNAVGAMALLLRDALLPNLIQTLEGTPVVVHMGPFGNIATGCNSVLADDLALSMADYVVTEAGFGADLGFEKFCHILAPALGRGPDAVVVVATVRGVKAHSGKFKLSAGKPLPPELGQEDLDALRLGSVNLQKHIKNVMSFGLPVVVAVNRFPTDTENELNELLRLAREFGAVDAAISEGFARGSVGTASLAEAVVRACGANEAQFKPLYTSDMGLMDKITTIATGVYGAADVNYGPGTKTKLRQTEKWGYGHLPICFAKTQYSFSHDPSLLGAPTGFTLPVVEVQLASGAGFVRVLCGDIMTMPGLPATPAAFRMDVTDEGEIVGVL
ncbi:MAG: formate--tetrahydrofolate ligase [Chthonomonadales bacterium]